ncbi:MAG: ATP-grasp domain-containing protein [Thiotrichales bacterium]|nr:ATP-grasp domain-containing protein [Thiotrichales bacterium]
MKPYRVLLIGPRRAILNLFRARNIPFSVWRESALYPIEDAQHLITAPFYNDTPKIKALLTQNLGSEQFSHVIAGTEQAVYPAAVARRVVGARLSTTTTALRCRDKLAMKQYLTDFDIPMTRFLAESHLETTAEAFTYLGSPMVRKQRKSSGGRSFELLTEQDDWVLKRNGRTILEKFVSALEASIESFVNNGKIQFVNPTQYLQKGHVNLVPGDFDEGLLAEMLELNHRVIEALKINWGVTHLEVYLSENGLLFGEIALRPPGGYIMNAMQYAYGFDPWAAFIAMELGEPFDFPQMPKAYSCVEVLHPGVGHITAIQGQQKVCVHPETREFKLKVKVGDSITKREGTGQDIGHLIFASASPKERMALYQTFKEQFVIVVE